MGAMQVYAAIVGKAHEYGFGDVWHEAERRVDFRDVLVGVTECGNGPRQVKLERMLGIAE